MVYVTWEAPQYKEAVVPVYELPLYYKDKTAYYLCYGNLHTWQDRLYIKTGPCTFTGKFYGCFITRSCKISDFSFVFLLSTTIGTIDDTMIFEAKTVVGDDAEACGDKTHLIRVRKRKWLAGLISIKESHYDDVIMGAIAHQITSPTIIFSAVYLDTSKTQIKNQSSASLASVRGIHRRPVNSPHKWPVTRKMFPFDDFIILTRNRILLGAWYGS